MIPRIKPVYRRLGIHIQKRGRVGFQDRGRGLQAMGRGQHLDAEKDKETDPPLESLEGTVLVTR